MKLPVLYCQTCIMAYVGDIWAGMTRCPLCETPVTLLVTPTEAPLAALSKTSFEWTPERREVLRQLEASLDR